MHTAILDRNEFTDALALAKKLIETRSTIPILSTVLLTFAGDTVDVTTTNLEITFRRRIPVIKRGGAFEIAVPCCKLHNLCAKSEKGVTLQVEWTGQDKDRPVFSIDGIKVRFEHFPAGDFPDMTRASFPHVFNVDLPAFVEALKKPLACVSLEDTRYYLNGVFLEADDGRMVMTGTDGHRMASITLPAPVGFSLPQETDQSPQGVILPTQLCSFLVDVAKRAPKLARAMVGERPRQTPHDWEPRIEFHIDNTVISAKCVMGTFPDYRRVFPSDTSHAITVDPVGLTKAIGKIAVIATRDSGMTAVKIAHGDGAAINIVLGHSREDTAEVDVPAEISGGALPEFGVNFRYLVKMLDLIDGDSATLGYGDAGSPILLTDPGDDTFRGVLMPMRV